MEDTEPEGEGFGSDPASPHFVARPYPESSVFDLHDHAAQLVKKLLLV